jgi:hypothetical protein
VLSPGTQPPRFELERGHQLDVRVVDAAGTAVDATILAASGERSNLGPGYVRFRRLPGRSVHVRATVGGETLERTVDPATQSQLVIRVVR